MKLALWMSCATALRVTPTMVQHPRRSVLAGGAAAAGSLILPAHAKKPLCLPGTNSAKALGGPGYTIGILEHDTPSFAAWHKVLEGFGSDLLSGYPSECKIIDQFFIKSRSTETGKDAVLSGLVFETSGLKAVKKFFDNGNAPNFVQGRKDGWLTGKWRENYFASAAAFDSRHRRAVAATRDAQVLRLPRARAGPAPTVPKRLGDLLRRARPRRALQGLVESFRLARGRCVT
jgi:hypothetical protein